MRALDYLVVAERVYGEAVAAAELALTGRVSPVDPSVSGLVGQASDEERDEAGIRALLLFARAQAAASIAGAQGSMASADMVTRRLGESAWRDRPR